MRKDILLAAALTLTLALPASAQEEGPAAHLDFFGVPIEGNITEFTKNMQPRYKLQKKVGDDGYYIYRGPVCGHELMMKADYTRKSRTVYRVTVEAKALDVNAFRDSLAVRYGEPAETANGCQWTREGGMIFLNTPQGYDPTLVYLDQAGVIALREEK